MVVTNSEPLRDIPDNTRLVKEVSLSQGYLEHLSRNANWMTNTLVNILNGIRNNTYYLNYRIDGTNSTSLNNKINANTEHITDLETEIDTTVAPIVSYINTIVKPRMITSYQNYNSINYSNIAGSAFQTFTGWNHIYLSKLLEDDNRYASIYVDKDNMKYDDGNVVKDKKGYTLTINEHINSPNFLPGKVYKLYFAGNRRYSLRILNQSKYNSTIRLLTPGLIKNEHYTKYTITNATNGTIYDAIATHDDLFSTYIVEIEKSLNQMFVTVKAGIEGLAPLQDLVGVYNKPVNATVTFYAAKNIFNPLLKNDAGSDYNWALASKNKTDVQPAWLAIKAVLNNPIDSNISNIYTSATTLRLKVRYAMRPGNGGIGNPVCYTYSPRTSSSLISKFTMPLNNYSTDRWYYSDQTIDLVKVGTTNNKIEFRGYLRIQARVTSSWRGFLVRIIPSGNTLADDTLYGSDITRTINNIIANPL